MVLENVVRKWFSVEVEDELIAHDGLVLVVWRWGWVAVTGEAPRIPERAHWPLSTVWTGC